MAVALAGAALIAAGDWADRRRPCRAPASPSRGRSRCPLYHVIGRGLREALPLPAYVLGVWATAAATLAVLARAAGAPFTGLPPRTFAGLLALALVPTVAGHGLVNRSLRRFPAPTVGLFLLGEPVAAAPLAYARLRRAPGRAHPRGRRARPGRPGPGRAREGRMTDARQHVHVLFTGGTISMRIDPGTGAAVPALSGEEIVARVHGLEQEARLTLEDYARLPGPHVTPHWMWRLKERVADVLADPAVDAVVLTHGTDTLEETAFLLDLTLDSTSPWSSAARCGRCRSRAGTGRPTSWPRCAPPSIPSARRPRRDDRGRRGGPRRRRSHEVARAEPEGVSQPARPAGGRSRPRRLPAPALSRRLRGRARGSCPTSTCTRWPPAWTTACCAPRSPAAFVAW